MARDLERIQVPSLAAFLTLHRRSQAFPWTGSRPRARSTPSPTSACATPPPARCFTGGTPSSSRQHDPLLLDPPAPGTPPQASLFERYVAYRAVRGDPMRAIEYETVADWVEPRSGYGPPLAARLRARAETAPATR